MSCFWWDITINGFFLVQRLILRLTDISSNDVVGVVRDPWLKVHQQLDDHHFLILVAIGGLFFPMASWCGLPLPFYLYEKTTNSKSPWSDMGPLMKSWDQNRFRVFVIGWQSVLENHVFFHRKPSRHQAFLRILRTIWFQMELFGTAESQVPTKSDIFHAIHT